MATQDCTSTTDAEMDELWSMFEASPAQMTEQDFSEMRRLMFGVEGKRTVSAGLFMLTKSGQDLLELMHQGPDMEEIYTELTECVTNRAALLREVADALDSSAARLSIALCDSIPNQGSAEANHV